MKFLHQEIEAGPKDIIEVALDGQANVMLLDQANYDLYRRGDPFRYRGGLAEDSPFQLIPPHRGRWQVVVDLGGFPGRVKARVAVLPMANTSG